MINRAGKLLTVLVVAVLGVWGCAKGPAIPNGQSERIRTLESNCAKLEEDYRAVASARDDARKKTAAVEEENKRLQTQLANQKDLLRKTQEAQSQVAKDRDELRQQIDARTSERDVLQFRCERMKKGIQTLLGQDEAYRSTPPQNNVTASASGN